MMKGKLIILSVLPFLCIIVSIIIASIIDFSPTLTEREQQVLEFIPENTGIVRKEALVVKNHLKSPIEIPKGVTPPIPKEGALLTLIMIGEEKKIAIINGRVVREGDTIDGMKILKIEKDKILVKSKETKWLYMEEVK